MSRELDAEVAEKVMGWRHTRQEGTDWWGKEPEREHWHSRIPHYSTDIAAAWQVVEKMQRQGFNFEITMLSFRNTPALSCAVVISNGKTHHEAHADTAPLAICLAALRAAGEGA